MIETAVVVAVLLAMLMGVYSVSQFASDQNTAGTSTRAGARLAGELGNNNYGIGSVKVGCQTTSTDPCVVDRQIVQVVCQIVAGMPFATSVDEIDIYRPTSADGSSGDRYDRYTSCTPAAAPIGGAAYTLDLRTQIHPNESFLGVSVKYTYKSPTPILPLNTQATVYTVVQLSPRFT